MLALHHIPLGNCKLKPHENITTILLEWPDSKTWTALNAGENGESWPRFGYDGSIGSADIPDDHPPWAVCMLKVSEHIIEFNIICSLYKLHIGTLVWGMRVIIMWSRPSRILETTTFSQNKKHKKTYPILVTHEMAKINATQPQGSVKCRVAGFHHSAGYPPAQPLRTWMVWKVTAHFYKYYGLSCTSPPQKKIFQVLTSHISEYDLIWK